MKIAPHIALTEAETERSWSCEWCDTMIEDVREGARFCWPCQQYQVDIANGLFDDDWREAAE